MTAFPRLDHGNAAVIQLRAWIRGQREQVRTTLEVEIERDKLMRAQGRAQLLRELEESITRRPYGERAE